MHILSHNITCNAKYFTQPPDTPQPLTLDWDEENLPEQVMEVGGFDAILYVSSHALGMAHRFSFLPISELVPFFQNGRRDIQHRLVSFPPPNTIFSRPTKRKTFTPTSYGDHELQRT
jgi:hypothetical protein